MILPYIDKPIIYTQFDSGNIVEFPVKENWWTERQRIMYAIKGWCTEQGLRNGTDYLFMRMPDDRKHIPIWFKEQCYASMLAMALYAQE